MASQLTGLFRKLTWADFNGPQPSSNPNNMLAQAAPGFSPSGFATQSVGKGASQSWQLADTVLVAITFDSSKSWVLPSVAGMPQAEKDRLLKHEQGHYDLAALLARDMFIEMMQLKAARLSSSAAVSNEVKAVYARYQAIAQPLQDLYDDPTTQTDHGRTKTVQAKWDGFIQTAFTTPRASGGSAPDGTLYKEEILAVLRSNSIPI